MSRERWPSTASHGLGRTPAGGFAALSAGVQLGDHVVLHPSIAGEQWPGRSLWATRFRPADGASS